MIMTVFLRTTITAIGPEVADLIESGVLILFAEGAPPELAEVSVMHQPQETPAASPPPAGIRVMIGPFEARITAIGEKAWAKLVDIGHVVIEFNGAADNGRPGVICAEKVDLDALSQALTPGTELILSA